MIAQQNFCLSLGTCSPFDSNEKFLNYLFVAFLCEKIASFPLHLIKEKGKGKEGTDVCKELYIVTK